MYRVFGKSEPDINIPRKKEVFSLAAQTKAETAYIRIKEMIRMGKFDDQSVVSENALSKDLQMSRTPVRSAVERLGSEGFLQVIPNQGILFVEPSIDELKKSYEIRIALEEFVIRELVSTIEPGDFEKLEVALDAQYKAVKENDPIAFLTLDRQFHAFFLEKYSNEMISKVLENIRDRVQRISLEMFRIPGNLILYYKDHREIIRLMKTGDADLTAREMGKHLRRVQLGYMSKR